MKFLCSKSIPALSIPREYDLKTFQTENLEDWTSLLTSNGKLGKWNVHSGKEWLENHPCEPTTQLLLYDQSKAIATALLLKPKTIGALPELGWVAVSPDYQGKGLGYQISLAVLHRLKDLNYPGCFLRTDDARIPAIITYFKLGFEPDFTHESHKDRWEKVLGEIRPQKKDPK